MTREELWQLQSIQHELERRRGALHTIAEEARRQGGGIA